MDDNGVDPAPPLAADRLVETLNDWGVKYVFTCPGSTEAAFLHAAVSANTSFQVVLTTHESIAVSMADGFARISQAPAVAYLHANVGLTNGLGHLYAAQLAQSPVVILTGLKQTEIQGRGGFTTTPHIRDFVRQYTKWDWQSLRADDVAFDVSRALQLSSTTPKGPTWIGLPQDLMEAPAHAELRSAEKLYVDAATRPSEGAIASTAALIASARRPIVVAGADVARAGQAAIAMLQQLAERLGAPVFVEDRRGFERSVLPTSHPQFAGLYDVHRPSVADSDLILFIGSKCFVEFEAATRRDVPASAAIVHVHSDAAEVGKIYGADISVVADSGAFLRDLLDSLDLVPIVESGHLDTACDEQKQIHMEALSGITTSPLPSVGHVMHALSRHFDSNTVVVGDATTSGKALIHAVEGTDAILHTTSSGSLGWGVGAAMGIKLGEPSKDVVAVCGDGAFQFGLQGIWTAVRFRIPVTYVVINNSAYAAVGAAIRRYTGSLTLNERSLAVDISGLSIAEIGLAFGARGQRIWDVDSLAAALREGPGDGPLVVEIMTDTTDLGP